MSLHRNVSRQVWNLTREDSAAFLCSLFRCSCILKVKRFFLKCKWNFSSSSSRKLVEVCFQIDFRMMNLLFGGTFSLKWTWSFHHIASCTQNVCTCSFLECLRVVVFSPFLPEQIPQTSAGNSYHSSILRLLQATWGECSTVEVHCCFLWSFRGSNLE